MTVLDPASGVDDWVCNVFVETRLKCYFGCSHVALPISPLQLHSHDWVVGSASWDQRKKALRRSALVHIARFVIRAALWTLLRMTYETSAGRYRSHYLGQDVKEYSTYA